MADPQEDGGKGTRVILYVIIGVIAAIVVIGMIFTVGTINNKVAETVDKAIDTNLQNAIDKAAEGIK